MAASVVVVPLALVGADPVRAADTVACGATASVFAVTTGGDVRHYPLSNPGGATTTWSPDVKIGSGWGGFGRVLGGPDGRVYGINSTGLYRYRWTGSTWETMDGKQGFQLSTSFGGYAGAAYRNKITVDERGDFYLIDGAGKLRWYRYDEPSRSWTIAARVLDTGWDRFDLLVAAGPGVLYTRTPAGQLFRHRFDSVSQRWIVQNRQVGSSGWQNFPEGMFSVGGDTLFGIRANGELVRYRYREDDSTWPVHAKVTGTGWNVPPNVFATTNTCRLTVSHTPARPTLATQSYTRSNVLQPPPTGTQTFGPIDYVYTDNIGRLRHGFVENPNNFTTIQWTVISGDDAFTGQPALVTNGQGLVQTLAHNVNSDVLSRTMVDSTSPAWQAPAGLGGAMRSAPAAVRLSDSTLAVFAFDADGMLWGRPQDGANGDLLPWRSLSTTAMTGDPVAIASSDGSAILFAVDASGTPHTATYRAGTLSAWTSLGGTGFTGVPAIVVMPGRLIRLFMRSADGTIVTQRQDTAGVFPGTWSQVGDFPTVGQPAAILDPALGEVVVVARGADNEIYRAYETAQGSGEFSAWGRIDTNVSDPAATDPVVAPASNTGYGESWMIVFRNQNDVTRTYWRDNVSRAATTARRAGTPVPVPSFDGHSLPAPPK